MPAFDTFLIHLKSPQTRAPRLDFWGAATPPLGNFSALVSLRGSIRRYFFVFARRLQT